MCQAVCIGVSECRVDLAAVYRQSRMPRAVSHVVVGAVYHPPSADDSVMTSHILDCLDTATRGHPHAGVVLLGDFNQLRDGALLSYPLRQLVKAPTRGSAVLDKIYTSVKDWYEPSVVLSNIRRSDHSAVVMVPKQRPADRGEEVTVVVRSQDANGRTLRQAMTQINWTPLYRMATCDEMTQAFYSTVTGLLDYYLLLMTVTRHTTDKPWVTDQFRHLIRCRQHALKTGHTARYTRRTTTAYSGCRGRCDGSTTPGRWRVCAPATHAPGGVASNTLRVRQSTQLSR